MEDFKDSSAQKVYPNNYFKLLTVV